MERRLELDAILASIVGSDHLYFQPPATVQMKYPCIRYQRAKIENWHADNVPYMRGVGYELTVIDYDPDSEIVNQVSKLPMCRFNRHYTVNNLNHDVFVIFH